MLTRLIGFSIAAAIDVEVLSLELVVFMVYDLTIKGQEPKDELAREGGQRYLD